MRWRNFNDVYGSSDNKCLMTVQAKGRNFFEGLELKCPEGAQAFAGSIGWSSWFKEHSGFQLNLCLK
jgi:hypothetical protein